MEVKTYPVLRPSFLCSVIENEWNISVTEQDLREPKPETVQRIYAAILADLLSLDVRSFERDGQLAIGGIENPEYYYESTRMQMLLYHMARVAKICKVQTFMMRDLTRPTGQRTIRVLSAICNFRAFTDVEERRDFLLDLQEQAQNKQQRLDERAAELQDLEEELASLQISLEQDKPELTRVKDSIEKFKEQMKDDLSVVDENLKHIQDLKTEKRQLKAKIEDLASEIQDVNRSNINDKSRIMQSPDRIRRKIQDMAASSEQLKPQIAQTENVRAQLQAKDNVLRGLIQDLREVVKDLENLKADLQAFDTIKEQYSERCAMQTQRQAHLKILTTQLAQADRQRLRAEEKLQEIRVAHQQKQESARRKHEILQERYRKLVALRGERDLDDSQQKEAMELIVKEQDGFIVEQQADIDSLFEEYHNIEDVIYSYMKDLDKNLNLKMFENRSKRGVDDTKPSSKRRKKSKGARVASADPQPSPP